MEIDYESMKKLMKVLDECGISYSFGNLYSSGEYELIIGHWLEFNADLYTHEIDDTDREYNN